MPIALVEGQLASGSFNASSGSATLPAGTTAGNTVLLFVDTNAATLSTPSGFVRDPSMPTVQNKVAIYRRSNVPADETSWTITVSTTAPVAWEVREYEGIDPDFPVDVTDAKQATTGTSLTVGPTATSTVFDGLLLVAHGANVATTTPPTWSGHTGGVTEDSDLGAVGAATAVGMSISSRPVQSLAAWSVQATPTAMDSMSAVAVVYAAAEAKRMSDPLDIWGFEQRTAAGLTLGPAQQTIFEISAGSPEVVDDATKARTGSGYLRLSSTAAAENAAQAARTILGTPKAVLRRVCIRFDGGLPSADTPLFHIEPATGGGTTTVRYLTASQKLGCQVGTGTEQVSDATVTADHWIAVDVRLNCHTTAHTCDWQITYDATPTAESTPVAQTQASFTASLAPSSYVSRLGWTTAITPGVPILFDDCIDALTAGAYPLGNHRIHPLKVDPAGTPSVSGTVGNFALITNNATGAALTSGTLANARDAVDDIPPTIGATADGVCVTAASASDYIELPMATQSFSGVGSIRAVKALLALWAASGTAATCRVNGWDGSVSTTLMAEFDPGADNSTTAPAWLSQLWKPSGGWTQAKLDAAAIRFGSNDATPDIGFHAVLLEAAEQVAQTQQLFGTMATQALDPITGGVIRAEIDTTVEPGKAADFVYEESGTPTTVPVAADTSHTEAIDAPDAPTVNRMELQFDPES